MDAEHPEHEELRYRHPVAWYGVIFGVVSGVVLAAAAVGKVTQGQEVLVVCGGGLAAFCYALCGALASRPGYSARDGLMAGLLAGIISAAMSVPVDLYFTQRFMSIYLPHMEEMHSAPGALTAILTPAQVWGFEVLGVTYGAISAVVAGLGLGWLGGYFGSSMRLGWQPVEKPAKRAAAPAASPPDDDAPETETPSGPHWGLAHPPSPPWRKP